MAISNSYPKGIPVEDADLFVGTKASNNRTVNYTAQGVADYLNINAKVSIGGQMSFQFSILPDIPKTISFDSGGGNNTAFSAISKLIVSAIDLSTADITIFLNYLNNSQVLLSQQNQPNLFGHYKIIGYTQIGITDFYELDLEYIGGNGTILADQYYDLISFVLTSGSAITPPLQDVMEAGRLYTEVVGDYQYNFGFDYNTFYTTIVDGTNQNYSSFDLNTNGINFYIEDGTTYDSASLYIVPGDSVQFAVTKDLFGTNILKIPARTAGVFGNCQYILQNNKPSGEYKIAGLDDIIDQPLQQVMSAGRYYTQTVGTNIYAFGFVDDYNYLKIQNTINSTTIERITTSVSESTNFGNNVLGSVLRIDNLAQGITRATNNSFGTNSLNIPFKIAGTGNCNFNIPNNKAAGDYTVAMIEDIPSLSGYVPTGRTLTINGTAYDLTADRSWSVGTVTSVGLSMPSAFTVSSSPVTGSGTIAVAGAGVASQYVRGDGTLANFPTSTGGGASVSYYLNGSVSQGTIGGVAYKELNSVPVIGTGTDFTINADGYIAQFITDVGDPNKLLIPAGNWNFETYFSASSNGGSPRFYIELYKYNGATFTLIATNSATPEFITGGTNIDLYFTALAVPPTTLAITDRLAVRFYVIHSGRTITMHTENSHLSQIITTFSSGLTALNGLTQQVQYFAVGTSGTDFNISSATDTHTFDLPTASATNRGALSSADWTTFNNKQNSSTAIIDIFEKAIIKDNYFWFIPQSTQTPTTFSFYAYGSSTIFQYQGSGFGSKGMVLFATTAVAGTLAFKRRNDALSFVNLICKLTQKIRFQTNISGQRFFHGLTKGNQFVAPTNVEPNTLTDIVGVCQLSTSTNMHVIHNDAAGVATTIDLGINYPCNTAIYNYFITIEQNATDYVVTVERVTVLDSTSISVTNTLTTNIMNYTTGAIQICTWISNNLTNSIASYLDGGGIGKFNN
jgi:hypothetical protein